MEQDHSHHNLHRNQEALTSDLETEYGQKHTEVAFSTHLHRHGPQVGAEEEEPHQLVGLYSHQVVDLPQRHLPHGHVGCGQTKDFVVNHRLVDETDVKM